MEITARSLADLLNGEIDGNPDAIVNTIAKIEEGKQGALAFLANPQYTKFLYSTQASIVLVNKGFVPEKEVNTTLIKVENAYEAFAKILEFYQNSIPRKVGIHSQAYVDETAEIGKDVYIGPFAVVDKNAKIGEGTIIYSHVYIGENAEIGKNSTLHSGVKIYNHCIVGNYCHLHSGVVVGSDGFGFAQTTGQNRKKVPQIGNVIIENNVEIGANTTIDRATMGSTIIREGVKLDNLIQIAHNVEIGENTVIASQSGVSGSTKIGKNCMIGGQVGIIGHISIADDVKIAAQSGIGKSIAKTGEIIQGSPAFDIRDYQKSYVLYKNLPKLNERILFLENELKRLNEKNI
ncbi:MAG: UDP-3-O-(3-hydroxymyristoyl)glucosamine N-acyltransferase [Bacteroidales bacterium]|nr:UDP-3-O-(3-hydroxymyristoyl)glucosamine N-acyltransferase [Bacteroidales bacterium]